MTTPEYRSQYILESGPHKRLGEPVRDILLYDCTLAGPSVVIEVPNAIAMDVLEALRAAYQLGREDNARMHAGADWSGEYDIDGNPIPRSAFAGNVGHIGFVSDADRPYLSMTRDELDSRLSTLVDRSLGGPMNFSDADREELDGLKAEQDRRAGRG